MKKGVKKAESKVKLSALKFIKSVKPKIKRQEHPNPYREGDIALA